MHKNEEKMMESISNNTQSKNTFVVKVFRDTVTRFINQNTKRIKPAKGKQRQYNLGKWIRSTYKNFLPEMYSSKDTYVFSTDLDRALMSAAANLAGLYPPKQSQAWNKQINWQPIPIHSAPLTNNPILQSEFSCPKHAKLLEELQKSEFIISLNKYYKDLYDEISYYTGWNVDDIRYMEYIFTIFHAYSNYNTSFVPKWYYSLNLEDFETLAALNFIKSTFTLELAKLRNGVFFFKILEHFDSVVRNDKEGLKLLMYSAHDATIAWILNGLNVYDYKVPNFASMIIWELYNSDNRFYVNLLYKYNDTYVEKLVLKGCSFNCDYSLFVKYVSPLVLHPDDRDAACAVKN